MAVLPRLSSFFFLSPRRKRLFSAVSAAAVLVYMIRLSGFDGFLKSLPLSSRITLSSVLPRME
jgi:hypothetical protein